ncbi:DUF2130 domain-containing protein [Candidatus Roizmanbacteria bacterium CG_4_9_14_0_2_um_filter_39_13]|uniref:DUF2130 domain-containing protein n=2 Tax=Candidatus Roizmaniibacteriota TaxID=1752723 RepID=A0A2M8EX50_9BACT|nr:MAG: DUF2130 domain-containing protein [Candidatus Roizmanbacteria bacterium CG_4_9_14_0_2_um_filter_39_13]PJE61777.1 MAG: DUF2130 domain-containing protein [Candidatus Roizmanbacteria bacterium CG10_big_fil_rev_8_21_14_0_10_39_12]
MSDSIICPNCKKNIPLTEAISHQLDEKYKQEITRLKERNEQERERLIQLSKVRIQEEKEKTAKEVETNLKKKIKEEMELKLKDTENESNEVKEQNNKLQDQLLELAKGMRKLQNENRLKEIEMQKTFAEEQEKLRKEEQVRIEEEFKLKLREKDKKLEDVVKSNEDLRRKLEQGSQQMQGEVLELAIEELLKKEFPFDEIKEVPKGINGADIIQVVKNRGGRVCGQIVWETKRTKNWSNLWISKLKQDQRNVKAEIAVLISEALPDGIINFGMIDGVWVCGFAFISGVAFALRTQLLEVSIVKSVQKGQDSKMELLYDYVTSMEFRHRVEAIIEAFNNMQEEIEKERRWFALKWSREEKNLRKVLDTTMGMHGDLQSIMGKSISELKGIEMLSDGSKDEEAGKDDQETLL